MANVSHASLTGSQLHEPKGIETAPLGSVYVANGSGSGTWNDIGTSSFTGMIADFVAPVAPTGWLELDGSTISTSTYSGLYGVMAMQTSGTRTNASAVVTSIPSTTNFRVGYYVFGTGINSGTTILSIDSATQITLSNAVTSSGTAAFAVSPWLLNTGTIKLPDMTTTGRYRRSRTATTKVGDTQTDLIKTHTHTTSSSGNTTANGDHRHNIGLSDPGHTHSASGPPNFWYSGGGANIGGSPNTSFLNYGAAISINANTTGIQIHDGVGNVNQTSIAGAHTHSVTTSGTSDTGTGTGTETRPVSLVVLTCVKT